MKKHIKALLILAFLHFSVNVKSQENGGIKLRLGLNLGAHLPNKSHSQFLNGSHPYGVNRILTDQIIRPQLEELFGYSIISWTYPANLKYDITLLAGGYFGFSLDADASVVVNLNLVKAKISEVLIINLDNPQNIQGQKEIAHITSQEQRFDMTLGLENVFNEIGPVQLYGAGGGIVNYTKLENHDLVIRDTRRYSIMRISPALVQRYVIDGFGFGIFGSIGGRYKFSNKFSFDIGVDVNFVKNAAYAEALVENTGYSQTLLEDASKFKLSGTAYFRIIWN